MPSGFFFKKSDTATPLFWSTYTSQSVEGLHTTHSNGKRLQRQAKEASSARLPSVSGCMQLCRLVGM